MHSAPSTCSSENHKYLDFFLKSTTVVLQGRRQNILWNEFGRKKKIQSRLPKQIFSNEKSSGRIFYWVFTDVYISKRPYSVRYRPVSIKIQVKQLLLIFVNSTKNDRETNCIIYIKQFTCQVDLTDVFQSKKCILRQPNTILSSV